MGDRIVIKPEVSEYALIDSFKALSSHYLNLSVEPEISKSCDDFNQNQHNSINGVKNPPARNAKCEISCEKTYQGWIDEEGRSTHDTSWGTEWLHQTHVDCDQAYVDYFTISKGELGDERYLERFNSIADLDEVKKTVSYADLFMAHVIENYEELIPYVFATEQGISVDLALVESVDIPVVQRNGGISECHEESEDGRYVEAEAFVLAIASSSLAAEDLSKVLADLRASADY